MPVTEYRAEDGLGGELRLYTDQGQSAERGENSQGYAYVLLRCARDFLELISVGVGADHLVLGALVHGGYKGRAFSDFKDRLNIDSARFRDTIAGLLIARGHSDGGRAESSVIGDDLAECLGFQ